MPVAQIQEELPVKDLTSKKQSLSETRVRTRLADGRDAYIVPSDDAGTFRVEVIAHDPWSALRDRGAITDAEASAASKHSAVWAATHICPEGRSGFSPSSPGNITDPAERMDEAAMSAWREFARGQASMPIRCRACVYNAVAYYQYPRDVALFRQGLRFLARFYRV